jgi:hypothetical protein
MYGVYQTNHKHKVGICNGECRLASKGNARSSASREENVRNILTKFMDGEE